MVTWYNAAQSQIGQKKPTYITYKLHDHVISFLKATFIDFFGPTRLSLWSCYYADELSRCCGKFSEVSSYTLVCLKTVSTS